MAFRFQKRVKIAPGLRLNLSKGGVSASLGSQGASVNLNKDGLQGTVGAPGTGLAYSTRRRNTKSPQLTQPPADRTTGRDRLLVAVVVLALATALFFGLRAAL